MSRKEQNYKVYQKDGALIKAWTNGVPVEDAAMEQLYDCAKMPFIYKHIAVMPDVHYGMGSTVGSVIPTRGAIIPCAVGVDIGCGVQAACVKDLYKSDVEDIKELIFKAISTMVPVGRSDNGGEGDRGRWGQTPSEVKAYYDKELKDEYCEIVEKSPDIHRGNKTTHEHLGTLGGGNHFIEVCLDENDQVWFMIHSGSRGVGARIGNHFMRLAKEENVKWFIDLPNKDLAYFPQGTDGYENYFEAVSWAQRYAQANRDFMMKNVKRALESVLGCQIWFGEHLDCHHNYVAWENHFGKNVLVTRKGAVRARQGDKGIITGSMGAKSFIVSGKGNDDSFTSCSHGAGRAMSRTKAKKEFTVDSHRDAMRGVVCLDTEDTLDETPGAYKDISAVIEAEKDLVSVDHTLKQIVCVKGIDSSDGFSKKKKKKQV